MKARAFFLLAAMPLAWLTTAQAQTGGIQIAPVFLEMSHEHNFASLHIRNGRDRPVAFEADVYVWRQIDGEDLLTPTDALLVAPGVFEIAPRGEQTIRLAVPAPDAERELAFRLILRELPTQRPDGARLGFTLEMSLPVFVTPDGAEAALETRAVQSELGAALVLTNTGDAHVQILSMDDLGASAISAPRYLLGGASAEVTLPPQTRDVRLRLAEARGVQSERIVHVDAADNRSPGR